MSQTVLTELFGAPVTQIGRGKGVIVVALRATPDERLGLGRNSFQTAFFLAHWTGSRTPGWSMAECFGRAERTLSSGKLAAWPESGSWLG